MGETYRECLIPKPMKQSTPIVMCPWFKNLMLREFMLTFRKMLLFNCKIRS